MSPRRWKRRKDERHPRFAPLLVALLGVVFGSASVLAQQETGDAPRSSPEVAVAAEMAELNRTLQRIHAVLDRFLTQQELDLLMKRIELKARRLGPLQSELRDIENSIESAQDEMKRLRMFKEQTERDIEEHRDHGKEAEASSLGRLLRELEGNTELAEQRLEGLLQRRIEIEDDLATGREEIEFLEEALDDRLGLR